MNEKQENDSIKATIQADQIDGQVAVGKDITQQQNPPQPQQKEADIGDRGALPEGTAAELLNLRQILTSLFNKGELRDLCFELNVDYENLAGSSKADKARELITFFHRRGQLSRLRAACQQHRPQAFK